MEEKMRLRYWRNLRALSVRELAKKAGVTTATISNIENHGHLPTNPVIRKLANALEIEPKELFVEGVDFSTLGKNPRLPELRVEARKTLVGEYSPHLGLLMIAD